MPNLTDLSTIRALCEKYDFALSKGFGQNFIVNPGVCPRLAESAGVTPDCGVLEIGPGIGVLTKELALRAKKVVSIEVDDRLPPILAETLEGRENVEIVPGDIMKLDIPALVAERFNGLTPFACANLPYNITSPVLTALIQANCFKAITVMIQREVALRICAAPGSSDYGAFSVFCQYYTAPELLFDVPNTCFIPAPKVTSSVIRLVPRPKPQEVEDEDFFFRVVRAAFALRRKTLQNSLSASLGPAFSREMIADAIAACSLRPDVRGERLGIPEFAALAKHLAARIH